MSKPSGAQTTLRALLVEHFTEDELDTLCVDLQGDYETVPGKGRGKEARAREIVTHFAQRDRLPDVVEWCLQQRPNLSVELTGVRKTRAHLPRRTIGLRARPSASQALHLLQAPCRPRQPARPSLAPLSLHARPPGVHRRHHAGRRSLARADRPTNPGERLLAGPMSKSSIDSEMVRAECRTLRSTAPRKAVHKPCRCAWTPRACCPTPSRVRTRCNTSSGRARPTTSACRPNPGGDRGRVAGLSSYRAGVNSPGRGRVRRSAIVSVPSPIATNCTRHCRSSTRASSTSCRRRAARSSSVTGCTSRVPPTTTQAEVVKSGTTTIIRAARQTGKSSLLVQGVQLARERGFKTLCFDFQRFDSHRLASLDLLLHDLGEFVAGKLRLDVVVAKLWRSRCRLRRS